jgi:sialate O-acetylesterase
LVPPLGKIDDADETFFNGKKIGSSGHFPPEYRSASNEERRYTVPEKLIRFGKQNVIAIRAYDGKGRGGLYAGPLGPIETK